MISSRGMVGVISRFQRAAVLANSIAVLKVLPQSLTRYRYPGFRLFLSFYQIPRHCLQGFRALAKRFQGGEGNFDQDIGPATGFVDAVQ
jgi:hypothetical protein